MNSDQDAEDILAELDDIGKRLNSVIPSQDNVQTQTVIHKTEGLSGFMGLVLGFAIATCLATWVGMVLFYDDIRDLKAWQQINTNAINKLETKQ
jgi:hypothetical protein